MSEFDLPMASFNRGQLPARQTKVVDENQLPLKTGSPGCGGVCNNDVSSVADVGFLKGGFITFLARKPPKTFAGPRPLPVKNSALFR